MISQEQIQAIYKAIVLLTHEHPGCRLHVELDEIGIDTEDGEYLVYDIYHQQYRTERCEVCEDHFVPEEMRGEICAYCADDKAT